MAVKVDYLVDDKKTILGFKVIKDGEEVRYANDIDEIGNFVECVNSEFAVLEKPPATIEEYFGEWDSLVWELSEKEVDLIHLKETYSEQEQDILTNTDFKELYGANNDKVRKNHIQKELKPLVDAKTDLELSIDYLKRRIDFVKNIMAMQRVLISSGALE